MVDHLLGAETDSSSSGNPNRKLRKKKQQSWINDLGWFDKNLEENGSCAAGRFKFVDGSWVEKKERREGNLHVSDARWLK